MAENPSDLIGKEFIFEYGVDRIFPPSEKTNGVFAIEQRCYRRERITRCRDCGWSCDCEGEMRCEYFHFYEVEPDGFCAWGKSREED